MTKNEFITKLSEVTEKSQKDMKEFEKAFEQVTTEVMEGGDKLNLTGFATFEGTEVEAKKDKNPSNGEDVDTPAHTKAKITISKTLRKNIKTKTAK